jgi:membrane protein YdbS with pleckstrin-like domain
MSNHDAAESAERRKRVWAIVRIALGMIQVMGATATVYWFALTGVNILSLGGMAVTSVALIASRLLFRD